MKISVQGIGIVGGFGCGVVEFKDVLSSGECRPSTTIITTNGKEHETPVFLADTSGLTDFIPKRSLRRVDYYSRLSLLGAFLALEDAECTETDRKKMGLIIGSGYGASKTTFNFLDSYLKVSDEFSSPITFSNSVHNAAAAHISMLLKITGPSITVSQFEMSFQSALLSACVWLNENRVDKVLIGAVDEFPDLLGYCRQRMFGSEQSKASSKIQPFEFGSQTAIAGEGAAFFLLSRDKENNSKYGVIEDVILGNCNGKTISPPEDAFLIIGADGHKICGEQYASIIGKDTETASFAPLYGSFPSASGFDSAIAAICAGRGMIYAPPAGISTDTNIKTIHREKNIGSKKICCLKLGPNGDYSLITVGGL